MTLEQFFSNPYWMLTAALLAVTLYMLMPVQDAWADCGDTNPTVLCVDADATGNATGLSWTDAFTNVQDALDVTQASSTTEYEIWVDEGVYYPDEGATALADSRTMSFPLSLDNARLYGGFAGNESSRDTRDPADHVTVLSGDIGQNDTDDDDDNIAETWEDVVGGNAYHVLWLNGVNQGNITDQTVIDGFVITAGQADGGSLHDDGGGLYCDGHGNGNECSPVLNDITFSGNLSDDDGGGMYNNGASSVSSPVLTNVTFSGNGAVGNGGGMYNNGAPGTSRPVLTNVAFRGNQALASGGGMYNDSNSPTLTNVVFGGNLARYGPGGGMYNDASRPTLTNVTFSDNLAAGDADSGEGKGGGIYNGNTNVTLTNCILWGNRVADAGPQIYNDASSVTVNYSLVQEGCPMGATCDSNLLTADPQFVASAPSVAPTTIGNYRLQEGSPAIDAGDSNAVVVPTDLDGNPRISGSAVDMGAYETVNGTLNIPPEFTSTPSEMAIVDKLYTYDVTATDPDTGDTLTITAPTKPGWLKLTDHGDGTATLEGTPTAEGDYSVSLKVSDGQASETQTFIIQARNYSLYLPLVVREN